MFLECGQKEDVEGFFHHPLLVEHFINPGAFLRGLRTMIQGLKGTYPRGPISARVLLFPLFKPRSRKRCSYSYKTSQWCSEETGSWFSGLRGNSDSTDGSTDVPVCPGQGAEETVHGERLVCSSNDKHDCPFCLSNIWLSFLKPFVPISKIFLSGKDPGSVTIFLSWPGTKFARLN